MEELYDTLEVEDEVFDIDGQDVPMMAEILSSPETVVITTETTEEPQDYTGPKITKRSRKEIPVEEMMAQLMPGPAPTQLPIAPLPMQPMGSPQLGAPPGAPPGMQPGMPPGMPQRMPPRMPPGMPMPMPGPGAFG